MYLMLANKKTKKNEIILNFEQSKKVYARVIELCNLIIKNKNFKDREDKIWIYQSLAQAYLATNDSDNYKKILAKVKKSSKGFFDLETFTRQNADVNLLIKTLKVKLTKNQR